MNLIDCFQEDFVEWLSKSNNPKIQPYIRHQSKLFLVMKALQIAEESLRDILDILLREPQADYFWYRYPEYGGELLYSLPHHEVVPGDALRVNKEKIKVFLRNYKLEKLGVC